MLPHTATRSPAWWHRWPTSRVVVVLPFVPVIATTFVSRPSARITASSRAPRTGRPASSAAACSGAAAPTSGDRPWLQPTRSMPSSSAGDSPPPTKRAAGHAARSASSPGGVSRVSATITSAPFAATQRAIARPDSPSPATSTRRPARSARARASASASARARASAAWRSASRAARSISEAVGLVRGGVLGAAPSRRPGRRVGRVGRVGCVGRVGARHGRAGVDGVQVGLVHRAHRSFSEDRPNSTSIIVTIQNRTTTWDSFTPPTSKWWCSGAIRKIRRPTP